ncbi:ATP-binding protein [Dehalobacter sp. DCM]|uniref:ATP-binding response regulator n=1 Tax=Dehalobacter sp. DCM TaxID=2907827 RepID=UPI003081C19F|nr:ATP-binding protein [Dehalobacter sp. DCM]
MAIFAHGEKQSFREFREKEYFSQELTYTNYYRMRFFSLIIIAVMIILMFIIDLPNLQKGFEAVGNEYKVLFFLHLSTGLSMLVFFGFSWRKLRLQSTKFTRWDKLLNFLFNFNIAIICALFSVNDQRIDGQITLYILGIYVIAIVNYHHPVRSLSIYLATHIIFILGITELQTNALLLRGYYFNSTVIIILAWFISNMLYYAKKRDFLAEKALQQSEQRALALVEDLKKIDHQKNQFLNSLSHELRNPLAAMMMSLSIIELADPASAQVAQAMEIFKRQTIQLTRLVDDLMEVTRITQNKIKLKIDLIELNSLVIRTVEDYKHMFVEKEIRLEVENNFQPVYILADSTRLIQIIENLLYNALKFTNVGGGVQVIVSKDEDQGEAVISVKDTGIGIKQELLEDLFLPFVQADISLDHSSGGIGLGLAIVKGMVELHGGKVSARSDGLGKGAQFIVQLPLAVNREPQTSFKQQKDRKKSGKRRILVIDDIPDVAEILCSLLRYLGNDVVSASDGIKGLAKAKEFQPDIIFCDIGLPGMNGYEVARNLRRDGRLHDVYLIALSGYAQPEDIERSLEAGFNIHVAKPIDFAKLEKILEEDNQLEYGQA